MAYILSECSDYSGQVFHKDVKRPSPQRTRAGSPPSSPGDTYNEEQERPIFLQPETRPITQEQLVNEVKGKSTNYTSPSLALSDSLLPRDLCWIGHGGKEMRGD